MTMLQATLSLVNDCRLNIELKKNDKKAKMINIEWSSENERLSSSLVQGPARDLQIAAYKYDTAHALYRLRISAANWQLPSGGF